MKIRIKFGKQGSMKFIGHLDVMRYFQKLMRRAEIDICYTAGFSPHQVMSFAAPLGVGLTSNGEYLDIEVNSSGSSEEMLRRLNAAGTEEIPVLSFRRLPEDAKNAMSLVAAADYMVSFRPGKEPAVRDLKQALADFLGQEEIIMLKKTKKSEAEQDIRPMIYRLEASDKGIFMQLAAGSSANLKPELVMEAFYRHQGLTFGEFDWMTHRMELYADQGTEEERKLVPLEELGDEL